MVEMLFATVLRQIRDQVLEAFLSGWVRRCHDITASDCVGKHLTFSDIKYCSVQLKCSVSMVNVERYH